MVDSDIANVIRNTLVGQRINLSIHRERGLEGFQDHTVKVVGKYHYGALVEFENGQKETFLWTDVRDALEGKKIVV